MLTGSFQLSRAHGTAVTVLAVFVVAGTGDLVTVLSSLTFGREAPPGAVDIETPATALIDLQDGA